MCHFFWTRCMHMKKFKVKSQLIEWNKRTDTTDCSIFPERSLAILISEGNVHRALVDTSRGVGIDGPWWWLVGRTDAGVCGWRWRRTAATRSRCAPTGRWLSGATSRRALDLPSTNHTPPRTPPTGLHSSVSEHIMRRIIITRPPHRVRRIDAAYRYTYRAVRGLSVCWLRPWGTHGNGWTDRDAVFRGQQTCRPE